MFDGAKHLHILVPIEKMMANPLLKFSRSVDLFTGEDTTANKIHARFQGWRFTAHRLGDEWTHVSGAGSYHTYFNNGKHNYNDFTRIQLAQTIERMRIDFGFHPNYENLNNIEFGVNITLPFSVSRVLDSLLTYKGVPFERPIENENYYQCKTKEFILKIYDKSRQFSLPSNTMRFEIKVVSMSFLKSKGIAIAVMADLLNAENYPKIGNLLISYFNKILFCNKNIDIHSLSDKDKELYLRGSIKSFWQRPQRFRYDSQSSYEAARKAWKRKEDLFRLRFSPSFNRDIENRIKSKWEYLTKCTPEDSNYIHNILSTWKELNL